MIQTLPQRVGTHDLGALSLIGKEVIYLAGRTVVRSDREALVVHVQNQVLTHHSKACVVLAICCTDQASTYQ